MYKSAFGTWLSAVAITGSVGFYTSLATKSWVKLGLRILASWIVSVGLLMVAFALKPAKPKAPPVLPEVPAQSAISG
jgi:hypothetical protein